MNILAALKNAASQLSATSPSPYLDAEVILQEVLQLTREQLYSYSEKIVTLPHLITFKALLEKRILGHSVAHIIGKKEFWKNTFFISNATLCPRPETELIIEMMLEFIKNKQKALKIAEFGVGSGCLIISILLEYKNAIGYGFEKSQAAYYIANLNKIYYKLSNRLHLYLQSWEKCKGKFDILVTNPPYLKKSELVNLSTEVKLEPSLALDGGASGINAYYSILRQAKYLLSSNGLLICEIGESQSSIVTNIAHKYGLSLIKKTKDLQGITRCLVFRLTSFKKV